MRKGVIHGPTIAAIVLLSTGILYFLIDPKDNKLEKIKIGNDIKIIEKEPIENAEILNEKDIIISNIKLNKNGALKGE